MQQKLSKIYFGLGLGLLFVGNEAAQAQKTLQAADCLLEPTEFEYEGWPVTGDRNDAPLKTDLPLAAVLSEEHVVASVRVCSAITVHDTRAAIQGIQVTYGVWRSPDGG